MNRRISTLWIGLILAAGTRAGLPETRVAALRDAVADLTKTFPDRYPERFRAQVL